MSTMLQCENVYIKWKKEQFGPIHFSLKGGQVLEVMGEEKEDIFRFFRLLLGGRKYPVLFAEDSHPTKRVKECGGSIFVNGMDREKQESAACEQFACIFRKCPFPSFITAREAASFFGTCYATFSEKEYFASCEQYEVPLDCKIGFLTNEQQLFLQLAFSLSYRAGIYLLEIDDNFCDETVLSRIIQPLIKRVREQNAIFIKKVSSVQIGQDADAVLWLHNGKQIYFSDMKTFQKRFKMVKATPKQIRYLTAQLPGILCIWFFLLFAHACTSIFCLVSVYHCLFSCASI